MPEPSTGPAEIEVELGGAELPFAEASEPDATMHLAATEASALSKRVAEERRKPLYEGFGICASCQNFNAVERQKGGFRHIAALCGAFGIRLDPREPVTHCSAYRSVHEVPLYVMFQQATMIPAEPKSKGRPRDYGFYR